MKYLKKGISFFGLTVVLTLAVVFAASIAAIPAQAAKKEKVDVITYQKSEDDFLAYKLKYFANGDMAGLLKKMNHVNDGSYTKINYASFKKIKSFVNENASSGYTTKSKYTYKKGRISKVTVGKTIMKLTYNAGGQVKKTKVIGTYYDPVKHKDIKGSYTNKYSYNAKGLLVRANTLDKLYTYKYDKKKNIKKITVKDKEDKSKTVYNIKNKYKKDRLVKRTITHIDPYEGGKSSGTVTYKYKTINVPKKVVKIIKNQQYVLLNNGDCELKMHDPVNPNAFPLIP